MERLNNIMGRTAQRRYHYSEQRSPMQQPQNQQAQQSQRLPQVQQGQPQPSTRPASRPPLREQNARQGQQRPYGAQGQPMPSTRVQQEPTHYEGRSPIARSISTHSQQQPNQSQRPMMNKSTANQPQRSERYVVQEQPVIHPLQTRPIHVSYHADEYTVSPIVQADVAAGWEDEEDDETGMQYGDWEEAESEVVIYQPPITEPQTPPRATTAPQARNDYGQRYPQHPLVTRELSRPSSNTGTQAYGTRSTRDIQQMQPPTPPTRVQEVQHHRTTQPLDPRVITEAGREHYGTQGQAQQKMQQRPLHQIVPQKAQVREQAVMPYTPASLPEVAPFAAPVKAACPHCKGAGYLRANVPFGHPNFGKPIACKCKEAEKKEKRRQQLLELSDLGAFRTKSLTNFSTHFPGMHPTVQEAFEVVQDYAQDPYGWLLLVGPNGCGKTHLAAAIANKCLDSGSVVLFAVVPDLLAHLRSAFAPTAPEGYDQLFAKMREAELLVLDDLGSHQSSPWASEKLFQLLNYRYNSQYPTVITANKGGLGSIDDRVLSRLSDVSLVNSVVMDGAQDYRRRNPRRD
ncbi:MAG: hypothetical protein NVS4B12_06300 [Ktedonobacteraceae bacterium]